MPPQTIALHVGGCGVHVGSAFWQRLSKDRSAAINSDVIVEESTHFNEGADGRLVPRAVAVDFENGVIDRVRTSFGGDTGMDPRNFVTAGGTSGGNWGRGFYTDGCEAIDTILDRVRLNAEACDQLGQLYMTHSLHGGAGSGLGALLLCKVAEEYPSSTRLNTVVVPAADPAASGSSVLVAPYNALHGLHLLAEYSDAVFMYHNAALAGDPDDPGLHGAGARHPGGYEEANAILARDMGAIEGLGRYEGVRGGGPRMSTRTLACSLSPYPRLKFYSMSRVDLDGGEAGDLAAAGARLLAADACSVVAKLPAGGSPLVGVSVVANSAAPSFGSWGDVAALSEGIGRSWDARGRSDFGPIPPNLAMHRGPSQPTNGAEARGMTAVCLDPCRCGTAIRCIVEQHSSMFRRKAFLHWYTGEGMDEMEFTEAESNDDDIARDFAGIAGRRCEDSSDDDAAIEAQQG